MSTNLKVLITDGLAELGKEKLAALQSIELLDKTGISLDDLKKEIEHANILVVRSRTKVNAELLEYAKNLQVVIRAGIGLDNVDIPAATDRGVVVMNAPTGNIVTTAEHAIALIFSVTRNIPQADASIRLGKWDKKKFQGNELHGKTIGVIGLGNIGKVVASLANGLQMKVCGYDPYVSKEVAAKQNIRLISMDELLKDSDYVTVHVPMVAATKHLIGKDAISKMKEGAYLINCARGGIVDESALLEALESGKLAGAALDVFEQEPPPEDSPLFKQPKVVLTPHLGASTDEAQVQVGLEVADQISQYVDEGVFKNAINVPNISREQVEILKPYLTLCERLGSFCSQIGPKDVRQIRVRYSGAISNERLEILTLSVLKGFLTPLLSSAVNFVNAKKLLKERGIRVEESFSSDSDDFANLIEVEISGEHVLTCSGTIFGKEPRIVQIDRFKIDALAEGSLLFTKNEDEPGVIGAMGKELGDAQINIGRMALGFDHQKGQAVALINTDSSASESVLNSLRKVKGMISVSSVEF